MAGGGNFFGRVFSYVLNELLVKSLAESREFQRFAVRTSKRIEEISILANEKQRELAEQMKEASKSFQSKRTW